MGTFIVCVCPLCDASFKQESKFRLHMADVHSVPEEGLRQLYVSHVCGGVEPRCACSSDCTAPLRWADWKHGFVSRYARGHNARIDSCWLDPEKQAGMSEKRREGFTAGRSVPWNRGLTKSTDPRVAAASERIGETLRSKDGPSWQASDPGKAAAAATKQSETMKGRAPWNKGLTSVTDPRIAAVAEAVSRTRLESDMTGRFTIAQIQSILDESGVFELVPGLDYQNKYQKFDVKCKECGEISRKNVTMLRISPICFRCHPKESKGQLEMFQFVKSLFDDTRSSVRDVLPSGKELDVYVPSMNVAVEFNGLYWHSEICLPNPTRYHDDKTTECSSVGIRLFHVFEDEWRDRRPIVESMLRNALGLSSAGPGARKLDVVDVDPKERKEFFTRNHLDGDARSEVSLGLRDPRDGRLYSVISLRKPFHKSKRSHLEVCRFASELGTVVPGALGRLSSAALERAKSQGCKGLMSYVDLRHGTGGAYEKAGWTFVPGKPSPRFWWTDFRNRFNRFKYRADREMGLTQAQVAEAAGVVMIWGCSNRTMVME